jgi:NADPH:quinone reductase-like Zn-dependent oxidoreductase
MKAALVTAHGGPDVIRVADAPMPEPAPGQVRVRVRASSLNHLDIFVRRGLPGAPPLPHIGGSDMAGVVDAVGAGIDAALVGLRVVVDPSLDYDAYDTDPQGAGFAPRHVKLIGEHVNGGHAEYATVPAANLLQLPDGFSFETAAAAGLVFVTAWRALVGRAGVRAGERVLVTGASGGVSTAAIQIAKLAGAQVYAVTSGSANVDRVRALGADHVYDRLAVDFSKEVWRDTQKRGVDVVLDSVGAPLWEQNVRALAQSGRLVTYGATGGPIASQDLRRVFFKQLSILGSTMGTPAEFRRVMGLVFEGRLNPIIHEVLPLDDARRGHELLESGEVFGKLVIVP